MSITLRNTLFWTSPYTAWAGNKEHIVPSWQLVTDKNGLLYLMSNKIRYRHIIEILAWEPALLYKIPDSEVVPRYVRKALMRTLKQIRKENCYSSEKETS